MDNIFTRFSFTRFALLAFAILLSNLAASAQVFTYTSGTLTFETTAYNPCGTPTPNNGYIDLRIIAAGGGSANLIFLDGPTIDATNIDIPVGTTYRFNAPSNSLPDGQYHIIIRDQSGVTINTYADPVNWPPVTLRDLPALSLTEDLLVDNTVCTNPTNGQVQSSIVGGSISLPGGGSFDYEWDSPNGLAGLPLTGTVDGTSPLNLSALLGVPGIPGGTYTLKVTDRFSACAQVQRSFTIADPSPVLYNVITPTPYNVCSGDNLTITLSGSESGVTYTILRNGIATSNSFIGTGGAPFVMTFPSTGFADNDVIQVRAANGFCSPANMTNSVLLRVNPIPTITNPAFADVCQGLTQTTFSYTGVTGSPNQFSIDFDGTANGQGFIDIVNASLTASPIAVAVPAAAVAGTYNGLLSIRNTTTGCASVPVPITINVIANPTITLAANPAICLGTATANLAYTSTAGAPNQYSINFDVTAEGQGFADVPNTSLPASPIVINVPVGAAAGTYNATITVVNTTTSCASSTQPFTITINPNSSLTLDAIPAICQGTTTAILGYSAPVGSPDQYSIDFNAAANTAGFVDVPVSALPASPINVAVPAAVAAGTYSGTITVINSVTGCASAAQPITITVNPSPTITISNLNPAVCQGAATVSFAYLGTTGSPTQYSLDFNAAAEAAGFVDVTNVALPASPITVAIPGAVPAGTYTATLSVRNGTTTCISAGQTVTITVNATPSITLTNPNPEICRGTTTVVMAYTGVTGGANRYTLDFDAAANAAGLPDRLNVVLPAGSFSITVPAGIAVGTYNGTVTVRNNATACVGVTMPITLTVNPIPTITLSAIPAVCEGTTTVNLGYTATTGGPTQYAINFNAAAEAQGFVDVPSTALPASPIAINVPPGAAPGTYTAAVVVTNTTSTCASASQNINIVINGNPTITLTNPNPQVCIGATTAPLAYSATTRSPNRYSLDFDATANGQGFVDITNANLPASPISVAIPGAAPAGTYNAVLTVRNNTTGCGSTSIPVTVTINPTPGATLDPIPAICQGVTSVPLGYTLPVGGADQYSIDFNAAANTAGFVDVAATALPASPINIAVPAAVAAGTYSATVRITNATTGCSSAALPISITVNPTPGITITNLNPQVCLGATSTTFAYTSPTGSPTQYSLDFNAAAEAQGFTDITNLALPASPITVAIPGTAVAGTYTATLTVRNATTTCTDAGQTVTITINPVPAITLTNPNPEVCLGATSAPMPYTGGAGADQYTIDFNAAAQTAGFADVVNQTLPASPLSIAIPAAVPAGTYNAVLSVRNSISGCGGTTQPITITIHPTPTITLSAIPAICQGITSVNLGYTGTTGSPSEYAINFNAAAEAQGFVDVPATALPATPVVITVPGAAAPGTYTATVVVTNTTTGCPSPAQTITIVINGNPTITLTNPNPQVCIGATNALFAYSGVTGAPNQYVLDFDAAAQLQGFVDVTQALPASPISVSIPGAAVAGTYNAVLTVNNTTTSCGSTSVPVTITIAPTPGVTWTPVADICAGTTTAPLAFNAPVGAPDQYIINYDAAAEAVGFVDIPATTLAASPVSLTVPAAVAPGTYNFTAQVINSVSGCPGPVTPLSITINPTPGITIADLSLSTCLGATSIPLVYTATTGSPTLYSINFNAAAEAQGFTDIVDLALTASPINIAIPGAAVAGTYTATITVSNGTTTCTDAGQTLTITIDPIPAITLTNPNPEVCLGTLTAPMPYTGAVGGADRYSIDFDAAAQAAGFADLLNQALPASPINIAIPGAAVAGTYNATVVVTNSTTGCGSTSQPITITIHPTPSITLSALPDICQGVTSVNLGYTATSGAPTAYAIDFNAAAQAQGFADVPATALPATPIVITVPATAAPGTYTATVVVTNATTTCASAPQTITIVINGTPTIAIADPNPQVCLGSTSTSLIYSGTTGTPDQYSLDFDAAAQAQGFADIVNQPLPASPIVIAIPGAAAAGTYNALLTVINTTTSCGSTTLPVTVTISPAAGVTWTPVPDICAGTTTASLAFNAPVGAPDQYLINFDAAAEAVGFVDVPATALATSPIALTVPAAAAPGTYNFTAQVINSVSGCPGPVVPLSITINPTPGITIADLNLSACEGATSLPLVFTATTGSPTLYSIDFNAAAEAAGFTDLVDVALPASPINIAIPAAATAGTYLATITVSNGTTTCSDAGQTLTITINPAATITLVDADPEVCVGATSVNFAYTATGGGADQFALDFDAAAEAQGFTDLAAGPLPASPITVTIPGAAIAGSYNATLIVSNVASGCASTAIPVTVTINPLPTITTSPIADVCVGTTSVDLSYTVTGAPDQLIIDFDAPAEAQGFTDISTALTASPFAIAIPPGAVAGTYNATVRVSNSATTCASAPQPISITVDPAPTATITGPASICAGETAQLTITFTGTGPWSFTYSDGTTTSPAIPSFFNSINIPLGTPAATTTYTIVSVTDATTCAGVGGSSHEVVVNQPPLTNLAVSVTLDPLCSGGTSDVRITGSQLGVSYQLRNDANDSNIGAPVVGTGGIILLPTGPLTATTTFNVLATAGGCTPAELTNKATVNVSGAINAGLTVTADTDPICAGSGTNITITSSENGVLYQLRNDADDSNVGAAVAGTGGAISLPTGNLTATTTFNVLASNGTCSIELTNQVTVTVGASPDASLAVNVTIDPLCAGGTSEVNVVLSQAGVMYQLRNDADDSNVGTAVAGTGGTISLSTGVLTATTTFNVLASAPGCTSIELANLATVNVAGSIDASLTLAAVASPICAGSGTDIELANSETGVDYQLRDDATGAPIGAVVTGTGGTIVFPTGNLTATTSFNVLASNGTCSIQLTDIETVSVDIAPDPGLVVTIGLNPLCSGGSTDILIQLSQNGVSYQLRNDADDSTIGTPIVGNGGTIVLPTGALTANTTFNILATSGVCTPVELTTLPSVTVSGSVDAGLTVGSSASTICSGSGTFITVLGSETGVNYQLVNLTLSTPVGTPVAGTGATINLPTGNLTASTTFGVIANNGTCSILLTDNETITVNPSPTLALSVTATPVLICANASSTITIANSEVGISYQLRNDAGDVNIGAPVPGTGSAITISTGPLSATTVFNVMAIAGTCSAELTNLATVTVRPAGDPACGGSGGTDCTNFSAIQPSIVTQPSCNDRDAGEVAFNISRADGTPTTFRILWTINGNTQTKFTAGTVSFDDLSSGLYQYTVIDEGNGKTCGPVDFFLDLKTQVEILSKQVSANVSCFGATDGNAILSVDGSLTGEYWYRYVIGGVESTAQTFTPGAPLPGGLPADDNDFIIIKVDDNFNFTCPDTVMVRIRNMYEKIDFAVVATDVTTCNGTDGTITVTGISGGDSGTNPLQARLKKAVPFSTDPSGYIVVADFADVANGTIAYADLSQGNYIVDVRDHRDCIQSKPIAVQAPGQVPLAVVSVTAIDATCDNAGESGALRVTISAAGIYKVAISQDQLNVPADAEFIDYVSPSLPNVTFANLSAGAYYVYIKSNTTTCPTRTDAVMINGVKALADFEVLSNCGNVNLTLNNITGQQDRPFVIRVFGNDDKFFKIDSLAANSIPLSSSVTFDYAPPRHTFLATPGTYRFVMVQTQTTGAGSCTLVSDTVVYQVRELLGITLGTVKPSFPEPKHTGSIQVANVTGGTRFITTNNELYYEISLTTADDDIVIKDWERLKLGTQNRFEFLYDYLPPGVYRVKVRDAAGCIKTLDVEIPNETSLYVPNIFTPNNDGINDEFEILNLPLTGQHQLIITNRWGNEVFKSADYREGNFWNADNVADGIYYYRLKVDGGEVMNGWVEIVRGSKP